MKMPNSELISVTQAGDQLSKIEQCLDDGSYTVGMWQALLARAEKLNAFDRLKLAGDISRVSDKLHRRNNFPEAPAWIGFTAEGALFLTSCAGLLSDYLLIRLIAVGVLTLCLQPCLKILTGKLLGVRYSYVYLWYIEPRFKMQYGSYFALKKWQKVLLQFSGSLGTPIALLIGTWVLADHPLLAVACLAGFILTASMQIAAFIAAWLGVRKVGPFLLTTLTTPALLAKELKS